MSVRAGACVERQTPQTPNEIYIGNVGRSPLGFTIDLRIRNETECTRARRRDLGAHRIAKP